MRGSVRKDGSTWLYEVTIGVDPETGKRKRKKKRGFATKREAQSALNKLIAEIESGEYIEPTKILFGEYLKDFMKVRETELELETFLNEKDNLEAHVIPALGNVSISDITVAKLQKFVNDLITEKDLKPSSVKKVFSPVSIALDRAVKMELIPKNPAENVVRPKISKEEMKVWTSEQVNHFLKHARNDRLFVLFHLAFTTGLRQGELLGLRWKDVDLENGIIRVTQTLRRKSGLKNGGKTYSATRTVTLLKETIPILKKHRARVLREKLRGGEDYKDNDLVICTSKGTPVSPRNALRSFKRLTKNAGLPEIRFHDIRHTHATLLLLAEVNPKIVAERLGHSKVSITLDTYSHVLPNMQKGVADKLSNIIYNDNANQSPIAATIDD